MKLSECLEITLNNFDSLYAEDGLCKLILKTSSLDLFPQLMYWTVDEYVQRCQPKKNYVMKGRDKYWWEPELVEPRKKWLEKHIKKLKAKGL